MELKSAQETAEAVQDFKASEFWYAIAAISFIATCVSVAIAAAYDPCK